MPGLFLVKLKRVMLSVFEVLDLETNQALCARAVVAATSGILIWNGKGWRVWTCAEPQT